MCNGSVIVPKKQPPTIEQVRRAMTLFARNDFDAYDKHMHDTGHYSLMKAGLSALCGEGHLRGPKVVDLGGGSGVLLAHLMMGPLHQRILNPAKKSTPVQLINVDATEEMVRSCYGHLLRRLAKMVIKNPDRGLVVYGSDTSTGNLQRYSTQFMQQHGHDGMDNRITLYAPDPEGEIQLDRKTLRELMRIDLILKDIAALTPEEMDQLRGVNTLLVSYCFHWFIQKPETARLIHELLDKETGRFVSIEEWPLRVSVPDKMAGALSDPGLRQFYRTLTEAIETATTPIEINELYRLFKSEGLARVEIGTVEGRTRWVHKYEIDLSHSMYLTVWRKNGESHE